MLKTMRHSHRQFQIAFYFSLLLCNSLYFVTKGHAAGFAIAEQSVQELGRAFSGAPTNSSDGSAVYFNPAAMSNIRGKLLSAPGYLIVPTLDFTNANSRLGELPLHGSSDGNSAKLALIPNLYYVHEITKLVTFGIAINTPYGLRNEYQSDWKGRYQAIDSGLNTININPAISLRLTDKLSFGAGVSVQYLQSKLTNAIDFGALCFYRLDPVTCGDLGILPQGADGGAKLKGDSIGVGYNLGILFSPNQDTRFGLSYRSRVKHEINGNASFSIPDKALIFNSNNIFDDTKAFSSTTMPDSFIFGFSHRLKKNWELTGDVMWTNWSLLKELRTEYSSGLAATSQKFDWHDAWRYAAGVSFSPESSKWIFRTGFAFDQTPVPSSDLRPIRIPDNDRYWLSTGFTRKLHNNLNLHFAYVHVFVPDSSVNSIGATGDRLSGKFSSQVDIFGLQLDYRF